MPTGSDFSQAAVFVKVQLFRFVAAKEGLYVRLILWALYPRIFKPDIQNPGCFTEAAGCELRAPVHPESQFMTIRYLSTKTAEYGALQRFCRFPGTAAVRKDITDNVSIPGIYHHAQIGIGAASPSIGEISLPIRIAGYRLDNGWPGPLGTFWLT